MKFDIFFSNLIDFSQEVFDKFAEAAELCAAAADPQQLWCHGSHWIYEYL